MTDENLLQTTDGSVWAAEFMKRFGQSKNQIDEELMISWFANAIETGRSHPHPTMIIRDTEWEVDTPVPQVLSEAIGMASMCWDPRPEGVFQSEAALQIADDVLSILQKKKWDVSRTLP